MVVKNKSLYFINKVIRAGTSRVNSFWKFGRDFWLDWKIGQIEKQESQLLNQARKRYEDSYINLSEPLVSVTIPTYNKGKLLVERTLPSIFNQTYQNFEIVIVGDGCTDETEELVREVGDPRLRFYNLNERGRYPKNLRHRWMVAGSVPGNRARELANGKWIAYLDDDDVFTPDHIEVLLEYAIKGNYELVFARKKKEIEPGVWKEGGGPNFPDGKKPFGGAHVPHSSVLYRSYLHLFKVYVDAWRYGLPTDNLTWQRMGRAGVRTGFLDRVVLLQPLLPDGKLRTVDAVITNRGRIIKTRNS